MADELQEKSNYPKIPASNWWTLRKMARKSMPTQITVTYLSTVLDIGEGAAKNLIPSLQKLGLIDLESKPTDDMNRWRLDDTYASYCNDVLNRVYPKELLDVAPPPDPEVSSVARWFSMHKKVGETHARQMASTYVLIAKGDPRAGESEENAKQGRKEKKPPERFPMKKPRDSKTEKEKKKWEGSHPGETGVSLHFNVQIHISPESSSEQIDSIFASIARHLRNMVVEHES